jgi:hypothetical protein
MNGNKIKDFDCIEMKRRSALWLHEQMEGMTVEQKIAFLTERAQRAREWLEAVPQPAQQPKAH